MATTNTIESIILSSLISRDEYARRVLPFLKDEYFSDDAERITFDSVRNHIDKYNSLPSKTELDLAIRNRTDLNEQRFKKTIEKVDSLGITDEPDFQWLLDSTEKFCQDKAVYNAIFKAIEVLDAEKTKKKDVSRTGIPDMLRDALSVSFDTRVGHDWTTEYSNRFDVYTSKEERIPFDLETFNTITNGGVPRKTLNIVMATTNAGKTLFMCHHAAFCLRQGLNVLYITCEMAEERIAQRIDANMLNTEINDIEKLPKEVYEKRVASLVSKTNGRLIIKEYPTGCASVNHFRILLKELKLKKNFVPDVVFVDYLNICASSRLNSESAANTYVYVKAIAEELRGFAVENDLPVFSATQSNRAGHSNTDVDLTNTAESWGLPATADFFLVMIRTEELDEENMVLWKQLKNRYSDKALDTRFLTGIDRAKQKVFDVNSNARTEGLLESKIRNDFNPQARKESQEMDMDSSPQERLSSNSYRSKFSKSKGSFDMT